MDQSLNETEPQTTMTADTKPKATVLVPLYIYPLDEETWKPLYEAITNHPNLDFLVIVNPNSGPGDIFVANRDYSREIPKLNAHVNVVTVGYIRIDYCKRPLSEVCIEIDTYAGWATEYEKTGLGVRGILLDETPNHYTAERAEYLDAVCQHIKATPGIQGDRLVIHNPGTPPDAELGNPGPDVIVTCEEPYERYQGEEVQKRLKDYHYDQPRSGYMVSGVPSTEIPALLQKLRYRGEYLFVTDLVNNFYESFGDSWGEFITAFET
ncbi:cell surface protein [Hyaloscypha finlandica]|nr:cell surface protein [Hyaloscypha finlandica]